MKIKTIIRRFIGDPIPMFVEDPHTLSQIAEDVAHAVQEVETEYGVRLLYGRRQEPVLTLSALRGGR